MNLDQITTKCWILALIIRDDGERLLLGDGWFDFKDSLQHFQPNSIANDIVELQGTDGQLLAGQVRRSASQSFDGYVGDAITSRTEIENRRRQFIQFFRTRRRYKVIYIFPDGTAIQRRMGYLTDAPSVPEMWQKFPEYHVALNFEDVNYYEYAEDAQGDEIYAHDSLVKLISVQSGGLIWDEIGAVSHGYTWLDPQTVTGDYITVTDGATGSPLTLSQLNGNSTQQTYIGKNLYDYTLHPATQAGGITWTLSDDGVFTITGTLTTSYQNICTQTNMATILQDGETYTLSMTSSEATAYAYPMLTRHNIANNTNEYIGVKQANPLTFTVDFETYTYSINIQATTTSAWGNTNRTFKMTAQLEKGSSVTPFEKYVGGTASPNPDYPQPISTVTGEQVVEVLGKNLFDINTLNKGSITVTDGVATGTALQFHQAFNTGAYTAHTNQQIWVTATAYTDGNSTTASTAGLGIRALYTDGTTSNVIIWDNSVTTATTKTGYTNASKTVDKIIISYNNAGANIWHLSNVQLELGSTATAYEPYQGQEFEVNLGKNLFYLPENLTNTVNSITITRVQGQSAFTLNGTNSGSATSASLIRTTSPLPLRAGTYTLKVEGLNQYDTSTDRIYIAKASSVGTPIKTFQPSNNWTDTFTLTEDSDIAFQIIFSASASYSNKTVTIQLELGQATSYAPYFTPIELAKIGNYQDRIYKNEGKWYIEKQVGKVVFDGSESGWGNIYVNTQGLGTCQLQLEAPVVQGNNLGICDHFTYKWIYNSATECFYVFNSSDIGRIMFITKFTVRQDWLDWLAANPTTAYYALATPTTTEITDETLLAQLNFIASLYGGVNNISIVPSAGAQGEMTLNYYADVDTTGAGYEWEAGEGGGPTIVQVIGVDNAQPIWTVTGPATNPTLTNITTVQTITWNGTVPNGQKLIIDMANQTATLAGANVYEFITGSWITLRPGANKLTYSAQGADQASQIQWNGVVG